jgi:hypothetical protein
MSQTAHADNSDISGGADYPPRAAHTEDVLFHQLQELLLAKDRAKLHDLEQLLDNRARLGEKVAPILEDFLLNLQKNFPAEYAQIVDKMIERKIASSKDQIIDAIYPALGKMITKYVSFQIQQLRESVSQSLKKAFSLRGTIWRIKNRFLGIDSADALLAMTDPPRVEEVFIIQRFTGILLANACYGEEALNRDLVAGMMTAIKAFSEDAFAKKQEELGTIDYDSFKIVLQNYPKYYIVMVLSGTVSAADVQNFRNDIDFFIDLNSVQIAQCENNVQMAQTVSGELIERFMTPKPQDLS